MTTTRRLGAAVASSASVAAIALPGDRRRPSARQLHDQPLRRDPGRARPRPPRHRHRPGRDPDVPGAPRLRHRRRRRGLRRRDRRRSRDRVRRADAGPGADGRRTAARRSTLDRRRADVPAGRRRALDDADRLRVPRRRSRRRSLPRRPVDVRGHVVRRSGSAGARSSSRAPGVDLTPSIGEIRADDARRAPDRLPDEPADRRRSTTSRSPSRRRPGGAELAPFVFARRDAAAGRRGAGPPRRPSGCDQGAGTGREPVRRHRRGRGRRRSAPPRRRDRRGSAVDLPGGRPHAVRAAALAADRRRARRRTRPDARPRQDADGRLPRRLARDGARMRPGSGCR